MVLAAEMRILDRESTRACTKARLQPLFDHLCVTKRWEELTTIVDILVLVLDWPENAEIFRRLLQVQNLPPLEKARAHFEVGNLFESHCLYFVADKHFRAAGAGFKELKHVYGEMDIEVARSGRGSDLSARCQDMGQQESDKGWIEILTDICARYKEAAFPVGMLRALLKLGELARKVNDFELVYNAAKVCSEIAEETGSRFYWIQFQISMLAATISQIGRHPTVIVQGLSLIEETRNFRIPCFESAVSTILSMAYAQLADSSQSMYWAAKATDAVKDSTMGERSLQEYRTAVARFAQNVGQDQVSQHLQEVSNYLTESVERDTAAGLWKFCVDKLLLLSQVQCARYRSISVLEATSQLEKCLQSALEISEKLDENDRLEVFASVQTFRVSGLMLQAQEETDTEKEKYAVQGLYSALQMCSSRLAPLQCAHIYCLLGPIHWSIYTKTSDTNAALDALNAFLEAHKIVRDIGITDYNITVFYGLAFSVWLTCVLERFPPDRDLVVLSCFLEMEKWVDVRRSELSALQTLNAIQEKQSLSTDKKSRAMYMMSLEACLRLGEIEEGWHWIQKGKARSVSDLLGLGIKIPNSLLVDLRDNPIALSLWEEEKALQVAISELPTENQGSFRNDIKELQDRMENVEVLRRIIALRKGDAAKLKNLQWAFDYKNLPTPNRSIVFVDWASTHNGNCLHMFVVDESRNPIHFELPITANFVESWREEHFLDPDDKEETLNEEDDDQDSAFRDLDALVDRLPFCSKPGDLLVFSPTGPLHSLPLHALRVPKDTHSLVGSMLLIERNPVIYCSNLIILEQCVTQAQSRLDSSQLNPPAVFAIYEPQSEEKYCFDAEEQTAVYEHAERLSQQLNAPAICGDEVTKASFSKYSTNVPLVHFHGHCNFESENILSQALILSSGGMVTGAQDLPDQSPPQKSLHGISKAATRLCPESRNEFSVEDIFNLNLSNPHITLIACDSASQRISAGDEPLGIMTAFLCAGATSVLGTIWPTATREGRVFSEAFYRCLGNQDFTAEGIFDYAEALREAVLGIRSARDSRLPYFWAPFVLHGSWFGKSFDIGHVS